MFTVTEIDRNDMVVLDRDECIRRLAEGGVGRVALVADGRPAIFPVNYALMGRFIYFLTAPGSKLAAAGRGDLVAFEVDRHDPSEHSGWSVVVIGRAGVVPAEEAEPVWRLRLGRWVGGGPATQIRIEMEQVSGREIGRPGVAGWVPEDLRRQQGSKSHRVNRPGGAVAPFRAFRP